jgi:hypothetical protein
MPRLATALLFSILCLPLLLLACSTNSGLPLTATPTTVPTPTPTPTTVPTPTPIPITVSATELRIAYENNEVAAKAKFEGKTALITGSVSSVTEAGIKYDVKLSTDEFFSLTSIVCKVDKEEVDTVVVLNVGQTITVHGRVKGKGIFDIVVESCSVR